VTRKAPWRASKDAGEVQAPVGAQLDLPVRGHVGVEDRDHEDEVAEVAKLTETRPRRAIDAP
jgi:hypothetical protein